MEGRYQRRIISEYLGNLVRGIGRSSPVASVFADWLESEGERIGIDLDDSDYFSDEPKRHKVRRRKVKLSQEAWKQLVPAVLRLKKEFGSARPSAFSRNLDCLATYFSLNDLDTQILGLVTHYQSNNSFQSLCRCILETQAHDTISLIALFLNVQPLQISRRIQTNSRLFKFGMLAREPNLNSDEVFIKIPSPLYNALSPPNRGFDDICRTLIGKAESADLAWEDFDHVSKERDFISDILVGASRRKTKGINFLLYGPPGTGKTEFCKTVAAHIAMTLFSVGEKDEYGNEPSRQERLTQARLSQQLLSTRTRTLVLFDEMEDLLSDGGDKPPWLTGIKSNNSSGSKAFINRLLEENTIPTFWTCNDIEGFDPAVLRRMTAAIELKIPPAPVRERVWHRILKKQKVRLPKDEVARLAREFEAAPALAANAVKAAKLAGGGTERIRLAVQSIGKAVRGGMETPPKELKIAPYEDKLIEADMDLRRLTSRLTEPNAPRNFSLCLYGPPGTGKSAYARHLAEQLGLEALMKRASDLLSMWVGGTEAQIAEAFAEARSSKAFLIIDEADSLLQDRSGAQRSWEITQTNEMLTWMEVHDLPFACTTNLMERLDRASLRRFTFKCKFDYLTEKQLDFAYQYFFDQPAPSRLKELTALTPGDFVVVSKKAKILQPAPEELLDMLRQEFMVKPNVPKPIGFMSN